MNLISLRRAVASAVSLSLVAACPGLAPYAAAQTVRASAANAGSAAPAAVPAMGFGGAASFAPALTPSLLGLTPSLGAPSAPAPMALAPVSAAKVSAAASVAAVPTVAAAPIPAALAKTNVAAASKEVSTSLEAAGAIKDASPPPPPASAASSRPR
ncbi:MAG: hypothetical protein M0D55_15710 [Elusimicrobiota bacterium]|nr:MAG: hypothetical protein M0D55_15710 [Elusimicrobiota bacterium]